jgi:hypothetical protein
MMKSSVKNVKPTTGLALLALSEISLPRQIEASHRPLIEITKL